MEDVQVNYHVAGENLKYVSPSFQSSVLNNLSKLKSGASEVESCRIRAGVSILQYLHKQIESENNDISLEVKYALKQIICGLKALNSKKKAGLFAVFVEILRLFPNISVKDVLMMMDAEFNISSRASKQEKTEAYCCRILVVGALIHSGKIFVERSHRESDVIGILISSAQKKKILYSSAISFLLDFILKCQHENFMEIWPLLKPEIHKSWEQHTPDTLHLLIQAGERFPNVVKKKLLWKSLSLGTKEVITEESIQPCATLLMNNFVENHPVNIYVIREVTASNLTVPFWKLLVKEIKLKENLRKEQVLLQFLEIILQHIKDKTQIPSLLCDDFMQFIIKTFQTKKIKEVLFKKANLLFTKMSKLLEDSEINDEVRLLFIKRILLYPGHLMFDKLAGTKVVGDLTKHMKIKGVEEIAKILKNVIGARKPKVKNAQGETCLWTKQERVYAAQLFTRLLSLPIMEENINCKLKQIKFLISFGLTSSHSREPWDVLNNIVASYVQNCVFQILNQKISKIDSLVTLLTSVAYYLHSIVFLQENPEKLRQPFSESSVKAWQRMISRVQEIESSEEQVNLQELSGKKVFLVLFIHMGLQLFQNASLAEESLKELHSCYDRTKCVETEKKTEKHGSSYEEPFWVEVIVDLFISLLSQNSLLIHNMIAVVFPYLCSSLTPTAIHQIIEILNPHGKQPLSSDTEGEDDSEDDNEGDVSSSKVSEDDSASDDDNDDDANGPVDMHVKLAVHDALTKVGGGYKGSDEESVDMDEMTEEERNRLDASLSEAFKLLKYNQANKKPKKQSKDDAAIMKFRIRVLGLIDIYITSQPSLALVLDIIIPLFELLEFCIKDKHQKPLENKVRACIRRLENVKHFASVEGVDQELLSVVLQQLLQEGERVSAVYQNIGEPLVQCSTFVARTSYFLQQQIVTSVKNRQVLTVFRKALLGFFKQRDSLLPLEVFKAVLVLSWKESWKLVQAVLTFAFDPEIRPFRRLQALKLLVAFFSNAKRIAEVTPKDFKNLEAIEKSLSDNTIQILNGVVENTQKKDSTRVVKENFVNELLRVLSTVWSAHCSDGKKCVNSSMDWEAVKTSISRYWDVTSLSRDTKVALKKLAAVLDLSLRNDVVNAQQEKQHNGGKKHKEKDDVEYIHGSKRKQKQNGSKMWSRNENKESADNSDDTGDKGYESENEEDKNATEGLKRKRKRSKANDLKGKSILKRQCKESRLASLSEGLSDSFSFSNAAIMNLEESKESSVKKRKHSEPVEVSKNNVNKLSKNLNVNRKSVDDKFLRRNKTNLIER